MSALKPNHPDTGTSKTDDELSPEEAAHIEVQKQYVAGHQAVLDSDNFEMPNPGTVVTVEPPTIEVIVEAAPVPADEAQGTITKEVTG